MDVTHLNVKLNHQELSKGAYGIAKHVRPNWKSDDVQFRIFTEGITNHMIGVYQKNDPNDMILIRVYGEDSDLFVDRRKERKTFRLLQHHGYAPKLYLTFENGMAFEYLLGTILNFKLCHDVNVYLLVAQMLAKMHKLDYNENYDSSKTPKLWNKLERFVDLIPEKFSDSEKESRFRKCFPGGKSDVKKELHELKKNLERLNSPVVLCHNDLMLHNVIYNEAKNTVTFIDFEYADYNYQAFDIAMHFVSFADEDGYENPQYPSEDYQLKWISEYLKEFEIFESRTEECVRELYQHVNQFIPAANFFYFSWNFMYAELSVIDFDYMKLATGRYGEYRKSLSKLPS